MTKLVAAEALRDLGYDCVARERREDGMKLPLATNCGIPQARRDVRP